MKVDGCKEKGFTLVELAVVLVIVGLLASALVGTYTLYVKKEQITSTVDNIKNAKKALYLYQSQIANQHFPCPADPADPVAKATDCSAPVVGQIREVTSPTGGTIRIGVMPVYDVTGTTMLVPQKESLDGYGRRMTYAVTTAKAIPGAPVTTPSNIQIRNSSGTVLSTESFVLLSHGPDGKGAYTPKGVLSKPCSGTARDRENCNDDGIFLDNSNERSQSKGANSNDDFVGTSTIAALTAQCPLDQELRGFNPTTGALICVSRDLSCPEGQAFVGIDSSSGSVRAACGPVMECASGFVLAKVGVSTAPTCVKNHAGSCRAGFVQVGTDSDGEAQCANIATSCSPGNVMVGRSEGLSPICASANNLNTQCPQGEVQVGNEADGRAICQRVNCAPNQYFYGIVGGEAKCNGDKFVNDHSCPQGQFVVSIENGIVTCAPVSGTKTTNAPFQTVRYAGSFPYRDPSGYDTYMDPMSNDTDNTWFVTISHGSPDYTTHYFNPHIMIQVTNNLTGDKHMVARSVLEAGKTYAGAGNVSFIVPPGYSFAGYSRQRGVGGLEGGAPVPTFMTIWE